MEKLPIGQYLSAGEEGEEPQKGKIGGNPIRVKAGSWLIGASKRVVFMGGFREFFSFWTNAVNL